MDRRDLEPAPRLGLGRYSAHGVSEGGVNVLSLFAGVGGLDLGLERAGHRIVGQVERDPFCQRVLTARWPRVARWADVREFSGDGVESHVDCVVGGFPCQDLSIAGRRRGLAGPQSSLFWEFVRVAREIGPAWGIVENVPGLLSSQRGRDFWTVLSGLRDCWPVVGWRVLDSQYFGVPQRRRRVFLVGGPTADGVAQVLDLTEGGGGDLAASGGARPDLAGPVVGGAYGTGRRNEDDPNLVLVTPAVTTRLRYDPSSEDYVLAPTLRRLTPLECERLQAFPDGWTCLCQPLAAYADDPDTAALACRCPDAPRYRALGNAVTVSVARWIGRQFGEVMT